ncbi:aminopeptidase [Bacillus salitolerans]|uniref:Aminopeptidase n=1 Tax=Bacillus salitolerans TaxID=1437434 RepID=A0ABW4LYQ3_9BACI
MRTFEENVDKYAELAVKVGVNIQQGQTLIINADISSALFVRKIVRKAYEAGARLVQVDWTDEHVTRTRFDYAPDESFTYFPEWRADMLEKAYQEGAAALSVVSMNPDLLKGVDPSKISSLGRVAGEATKRYMKYTRGFKISWSIVAVPSEAWAAKVFPGTDSKDEQIEKLWNAIFDATRISLEDPIQAWNDHIQSLMSKVNLLNELELDTLHYSAPGTDLTIELAKKHIWVGAESINDKGNSFIANIPTEEVFTTPLKTGVNGTVRGTKPFNYGGNVIDHFSFTFEDGRIVDFDAEEGYEALKRMLETDEGSLYLGEVALVPHCSPISNSGITFYNTLFDENASHHLAIGNSYTFTIENGYEMTEQELADNGVNNSANHVDFMIGSSEMNIDGKKKDGRVIPLFRNGEWVI